MIKQKQAVPPKNGKPERKNGSYEKDDELSNMFSLIDTGDSSDEKSKVKTKQKPKKKKSVDKVPSAGNPRICESIKKTVQSIRALIDKSPDKNLAAYFDSTLKKYTPVKTEAVSWAASENKLKNRTGFPCYDHTRVPLSAESGKKNLYINANFVDFKDINRQYIMTQYPLEADMENFWGMVFENEVEIILSIFNPRGDQDIPEHRERLNAKLNLAKQGTKPPVRLSSRESLFHMSENQANIAEKSQRCPLMDSFSYFPLMEGQYMTIGRFFVHTRKVEGREGSHRPMVYTVEILPEGCSECKFIRVVNYANWGKALIPKTTIPIRYLCRHIDEDSLRKGPIVVHCDTGIDRSATLVMTDVITQRIFDCRAVDCEDIFMKIRDHRGGAFQSSRYFVGAIYASLNYAQRRCNIKGQLDQKTNSLLIELIEDFKKFYKPAELNIESPK